MKRTKKPKGKEEQSGSETIRLPDAINIFKLGDNFTIISNDVIRDPNLSAMEKIVLMILISNKEGYWVSYSKTIAQMTKEGRDAINSALRGLEKHGYLLRLKFRDKNTKVWKGSFWAITNLSGCFDYRKHERMIEESGYEICYK